MSKTQRREVEVHAHWLGLPQPVLMGILQATIVRGKEIFSFEYNDGWLKSDQSRVLDPSLLLFQGSQYPPSEQENFGRKKQVIWGFR